MNDLINQNEKQPLFDENKDYFSELVGENAKFKTPQALAASKVRSDLYIEDILRSKDEQREAYDRLADDYASLKKQYDARASLEEQMDQIESRYLSRETPKQVTNIQPQQTQPKSIDYDQFEDWASKREQRKTEDQNLNESKRLLKEHLGENYLQVVRERINGLDIDVGDVNQMARRSPKMLARVLGLEQQQPDQQNLFQAPPQNQRRNDNFKPSVQKRTWSYYQELKKTNPRIMLDPKIAVQMHNDHISMGSAFEDGDFHQNN